MGLFPFQNHVIAKERKSAEPLCRQRRPLGQRVARPERAEEVEEEEEEPPVRILYAISLDKLILLSKTNLTIIFLLIFLSSHRRLLEQ